MNPARAWIMWGLVGALGVLLTGCLGPRRVVAPEELTSEWTSPAGLYRIRYGSRDAREVEGLRRAVDAALPRLERWGHLREPLTLFVLPDHRSLEAAVHQRGLRWLRAWSRYDEVFLQAPSTWGFAGASPVQVDELLLHELTHSLMYQLSADRLGWTRKAIPLWFREGMASYTAEQAYRWGTLETLARFLEHHLEEDPLHRPEGLYRDESDLVYGMAHHAFTFLVRRYGEASVREVLREMKAGEDFPTAFATVIGLGPDAFTRDFTHYVRWRGFQGGRSLTPPPVEAAPEAPARAVCEERTGERPGASGGLHPP